MYAFAVPISQESAQPQGPEGLEGDDHAMKVQQIQLVMEFLGVLVRLVRNATDIQSMVPIAGRTDGEGVSVPVLEMALRLRVGWATASDDVCNSGRSNLWTILRPWRSCEGLVLLHSAK
jgi:hypothetical protein